MEQVMLDGRCLKERERAHRYLKEKLKLPEYYGNNLDALRDLLTEGGEPLTIRIRYSSCLCKEEGYGARILKVLKAAAKERENLSVVLE